MTRLLAAAIAVVLVTGVAGALTSDDEGGALDAGSARSCGVDLARDVGLDPGAASATIEDETWRVDVALSGGALRLVVRRVDGRVLDAVMVGPGGAQPLDRTTRLAIYERGC